MNRKNLIKSKKINKQIDNTEVNFGSDRANFDTSIDGKINIDSKYKN